jgi:DNA-binding NarL/FixJ family response regulator
MKQRRILIADENKNVRRHVRTILTGHANWKVVDEAAAEGELLTKVNQAKPDIIMMDIATPVLGGLGAAKKILGMQPNALIIVLSASDEEGLIRDALQLGVRGFISKRHFSREIVSAIRSVSSGRRFLDGRVSDVVMKGYLEGSAGAAAMPVSLSRLTARELEIARLLAMGNGNKQVAKVLGIRVRTVETHRANTMRKLNLHSLAELIHYAVSHQIIHIDVTPVVPAFRNNTETGGKLAGKPRDVSRPT